MAKKKKGTKRTVTTTTTTKTVRTTNPIEPGTLAWYRRNLLLPLEAGDDSSVKVLDTLYSWHGGQGSAVYSLASTGSSDYVSASMIDRALTELRQDLRKAKGISAKDKKDLKTVIEELSGVLGFPDEHTIKEATGEDTDSGYDEYGMRIDEFEENPSRKANKNPKRGKRGNPRDRTSKTTKTTRSANPRERKLAKRLAQGGE